MPLLKPQLPFSTQSPAETINDKGLQVILEALSRYYPHIKFEKRESAHYSELPYEDLVNLTSILIHFTSICKKKDTLRSAMCTDLDETTQMYIKKFLESVSYKTTNSQLAKAIESLFGPISFPSADSPGVAKKLPMETPTRKYMRIRHGNMLKALEQELESERADREAETKQLEELVSKLSKCSQ